MLYLSRLAIFSLIGNRLCWKIWPTCHADQKLVLYRATQVKSLRENEDLVLKNFNLFSIVTIYRLNDDGFSDSRWIRKAAFESRSKWLRTFPHIPRARLTWSTLTLFQEIGILSTWVSTLQIRVKIRIL